MAFRFAHVSAFVLFVASVAAQQSASPQELRQAAIEAPQLIEVLELKPGMAVADVGAGFGAVTIVLSERLGPAGRLYATDITPHALSALRAEVAERKLSNVTIIEGGAATTNLPDACCDAIFLRDVYHHIGNVEAFNVSIRTSLKADGRLAIIDFAPEAGSELPEGVPTNRGGHGIRPELVIDELTKAGFAHVRTIPVWPPYGKGGLFLVLFRR
jgi:ubiquinone/menaquinone biosynthesis C-methylase UbiE